MSRLLIFIFLVPLILLGEPNKIQSNTELTKIYTQAITDFIKTTRNKNKITYDTLFFGKHIYGQSDDFPDIDLPKKIENIEIVLISPEIGEKSQNELKSRIYINLFGWVEKRKAEFIFVVFSNGFEHQFDYNINYKYNKKKKEFELEKVQFKGPPFKK